MYASWPTWPNVTLPAALGRTPRAVPEPTDADLVAVARRDPAAFDALYRRYVPAVFRYVRARVTTLDDAEDITAVTFMSALQSLDRYEERGLFAAWLFTIARRQIVAHRRSGARGETEPIDDAAHRLAAADGEPDAAGLEARDALRAAMLRLTPDQREAITLRFYGGLRVLEVAAVLGKDESAVKMILHRGLRKLRDGLDGRADAGPAGRIDGGPS